MVIDKKKRKILKFVEVLFATTDFVGTVFVISITSPNLMTESSMILAKYLPFSQLHVAGFKYNLFRTNDVLLDFYTHIEIYCYSTFDLNYIFYRQIYIYTRMIYAC